MRLLSIFVVFIVSVLLIGCSSTPRTKFTDKSMRVLIDPDSVSVEDYVRIRDSLVKTGKWIVVDRQAAFQAIKKEQERLHRNQVDRFDDKQKWAHWGKLYGVGGVVVGHSQCRKKKSFWGTGYLNHCQQYLAIADANTGEIIATSRNEESAPWGETPDWEDVVVELNNSYPETYEPNREHKKVTNYKAESKEHSIRQKEKAARELAEQEQP